MLSQYNVSAQTLRTRGDIGYLMAEVNTEVRARPAVQMLALGVCGTGASAVLHRLKCSLPRFSGACSGLTRSEVQDCLLVNQHQDSHPILSRRLLGRRHLVGVVMNIQASAILCLTNQIYSVGYPYDNLHTSKTKTVANVHMSHANKGPPKTNTECSISSRHADNTRHAQDTAAGIHLLVTEVVLRLL